uniref:Uncharacterized protein n=1 Tax=Anguilla anguilla TaxID=7936 RepID=A0A0E9PIT6_ANGAN
MNLILLAVHFTNMAPLELHSHFLHFNILFLECTLFLGS